MTEYVNAMVEKSLSPERKKDGDYVDDATGLLMCHVCGTPMESYHEFPGRGRTKVGIVCRCAQERLAAEETAKKRKVAENRRKDAFGCERSKRFGFTFEADDGKSPHVSDQLKRYCDNFADFREKGVGLLLYSPRNGGGKTFFACAVANRLIDDGYSVRVTDILELRDEMARGDRNAILRGLCDRNALVVLDDVGAENASEFTTESEFRIINTLVENSIPMVVTTNYTPMEFANHADRAKRRVYDRILGCCVPIKVDPPGEQSRRLEKCREILDGFRDRIGEG